MANECTIPVKLIAKVASTAMKWIREDQANSYALLKRHVSRIHAEGIGCFNFDNGQYSIMSPTPNDVIITAEPFGASTHYWDGPSLTWDMSLFNKDEVRKDGLFEASLNHDLTFEFAEQIAKANNTTIEKVHLWANRVLQIEMKHYAKVKIKAERFLLRRILDFGASLYSKVRGKAGKTVVVVLGIAIMLTCCGCADFIIDEDGTVEADPIEWSK